MFEDEVAHVDNEHLKHMYYDLGIAGYVLAVAAIGGMVVLVILRRRNLKKSRHDCADEAVDSEETISI